MICFLKRLWLYILFAFALLLIFIFKKDFERIIKDYYEKYSS